MLANYKKLCVHNIFNNVFAISKYFRLNRDRFIFVLPNVKAEMHKIWVKRMHRRILKSCKIFKCGMNLPVQLGLATAHLTPLMVKYLKCF